MKSAGTKPSSRASEVRAALCDEIAAALQAVWEHRRPGDATVHEVRKDLKRARAALRLLREAVGDATYARENAELRDAARPLAGVRDAAVTLEAVDELLDEEKKPARRALLRDLRRSLVEERRRARRKLVRGRGLSGIALTLQDAGQRVEYWRVPREDIPVLRAGFERVYRKGRKALKKARAEGTTESLHESRKQAKYLHQALSVIALRKSGRLAKAAKRAQAVADGLGEDHDLAVLQALLAALPADAPKAKKLLKRIQSRRAKLQRKALKQAQRLYGRKPAAFLDRVLG